MSNVPLVDMFKGCVIAAGAGGADSIFQDAQHETGENSGVGPLPADINMVGPPSYCDLPGSSTYGTDKVHSKQYTVAVLNSYK